MPERSADCPCPEMFKRQAYCDDCPYRPEKTVYGALARAEALRAGYPDWPLVTRWPLEEVAGV